MIVKREKRRRGTVRVDMGPVGVLHLPAKSCRPRIAKTRKNISETSTTGSTSGKLASRQSTASFSPGNRRIARSGRRARSARTPRIAFSCGTELARIVAYPESTMSPSRRFQPFDQYEFLWQVAP